MAMISLKEWLDWWESKGKAISYCYIGNGGKVVNSWNEQPGRHLCDSRRFYAR